MKIIYINGIKATYSDLATLFERIRKGSDYILAIRRTRSNNIAIVTAR